VPRVAAELVVSPESRLGLVPSDRSIAGRVLVIEDDVAVIRVVERSLRAAGFETIAALEGQEGVAIARSKAPDLVLCDIGMPGMDGHTVLQQLRQDDQTRDIPFIFLTGSVGHEDIRLGMRLGADDYLTKPFMPKDLVEAVQARIARRRQITEGLQGKLAAMMHRIDFGGVQRVRRASTLPDRQELEIAVASELVSRSALATPRAVAVVRTLDVERNCVRLGHVALEALQQHIEERLAEAVRSRGVPCRICRLVGFGRFGVVFHADVGLAAATTFLQGVMETLRAAYWLQGSEVFVQFSAGIALGALGSQELETQGGMPEDLTRLLLQAETAARPAAGESRQHVGVYRDGMRTEQLENLRLDADLHHAVQRSQLHLVYQPQVELASDIVIGFEALVRWEHPEFGMVSPAHFIPLAEQNGTILRIGEWVLREACRQFAAWHARGFPAGRVAVNVSAVQMQEGDIPGLVRSALAESGLEPSRLQLEVTESAVLHDMARAKAVLREVRDLGVSVAIDDFGTGHSSLAYLQQLKFDELKVDRSFVQGMEYHADRIAIVELILNLAEKLGFLVTAEGIENAATRDLLTSRRCQLGQGYYFARPMPVDAVVGVMQLRRPGSYLKAPDLAATPRASDDKGGAKARSQSAG
jgi:EAL domain-containing protein (putative c-di-GMP-specific phosphodiesterase class I)/CheY-like chemotaxis protein